VFLAALGALALIVKKEKKFFKLIASLIAFFAILSLNKHKEDRFMLPAFPIMVLLATYCSHNLLNMKLRQIVLVTGPIVNFILLYLYGYVIDDALNCMDYIREEVHQNRVSSLYFFMPCHTIPYLSFIHK